MKKYKMFSKVWKFRPPFCAPKHKGTEKEGDSFCVMNAHIFVTHVLEMNPQCFFFLLLLTIEAFSILLETWEKFLIFKISLYILLCIFLLCIRCTKLFLLIRTYNRLLKLFHGIDCVSFMSFNMPGIMSLMK